MAFQLTYPPGRELTGGDLLAQSLKFLGTEVAFGLHGAHLDAFLVGCKSMGIRLVDTRHETVAVQAAETYAKMTGNFGVCFITANAGFVNGLPGLATAMADRSPVVCITSSPPLRMIESNSLQGQIDQVVVSRQLTKYAYRITHAEDIPRILAHALHIAVSGAAGPVVLDVPVEVLYCPVDANRIAWGGIQRELAYHPGPTPSAVREILQHLKEAKKPVIIVGSGTRSPKATAALKAFTQTTQIPLFHSGKFARLSALRESSSFIGFAPKLMALSAGNTPPDCILLLGARTGMFLGEERGLMVPNKNCKIIQVDTDGSELGRSFPTLGVVSGTAEALEALNAAVDQNPFKAPAEWIERVFAACADGPSPHLQEPAISHDGLPHPFHALSSLFKELPEDSIVVVDGGECVLWTMPFATSDIVDTAMWSMGYLGLLGTGFGHALGCAIADPDRLVVNVQGDGSAGFHLMELDTYARHGAKILTVILNNSAWGISLNGQDLMYGTQTKHRPITTLSPDTNYAIVASGLNNDSAKVSTIEEIGPAVRRLLATKKPSCLDLRISRFPIHPGTVAMTGASNNPDIIAVPYYENVPRPYYK